LVRPAKFQPEPTGGLIEQPPIGGTLLPPQGAGPIPQVPQTPPPFQPQSSSPFQPPTTPDGNNSGGPGPLRVPNT
jgi:hypothetical protein